MRITIENSYFFIIASFNYCSCEVVIITCAITGPNIIDLPFFQSIGLKDVYPLVCSTNTDQLPASADENAIAEAKKHVGVPSAIVLETVKGKGCGFAMNRTDNHDMRIDEDMLSSGMHDLEAIYKQFVEE